MEVQTIGKRITALRKEKGMTQEQLAERLGVSAQAVSKWEIDVSCPDISIIAELAKTLNVSTDELLGAKPMEPRVVVVDTSTNKEKNQNGGREFSATYSGGKRSGIWFAVAMILVGLAFILSRTNVLPNGAGVTFWNIVWPAVLIGVGVSWFVHDFSPLGLGVAGLGFYYLLFHLGAVAFELSWSVIWPILVVLLGLTILMDILFPNRSKFWNKGHHEGKTQFNVSGGYLKYDCTFSDENRKVEADEFSGADVDVSFGKSVLDLTSIKSVRDNTIIDVDVSFGAMEILMPRSIRLVIESDKAFGAIQQHGEPFGDATMSILLRGDVSFGSLEIRYL